MQKKDPVFILLICVFAMVFITLLGAIIFQTAGIMSGKKEDAAAEETAVTEEEIPEELKEQIETGNVPSFMPAENGTEEYTGEGDAPEDIEYIREDLPDVQRERLDSGNLWEPMDEN